jgi:hypothetical protein
MEVKYLQIYNSFLTELTQLKLVTDDTIELLLDESDEKSLLHFLDSSSVINALCEVSFSSVQSINLTSSINTNTSKRIAGTQTLVALNRFDEARATARQLKDCYNEAELEIPTLGISHSTLTDIFSTLPHSIEVEIITLSKRLLILLPVLELASIESSALKELIKKLEEDLKLLKEEEDNKNETKTKVYSSSLTHIPTAVKQIVFASPPLPPMSSSFSSSKSLEQEQYDAANAAARAMNTPCAYSQTISSSPPLAARNAARVAMAAASAAALSVNKAPKPPPTPFTSTFATLPKSPLSSLIGVGGVFSYSSQQK